jgi:hypothetical protein
MLNTQPPSARTRNNDGWFRRRRSEAAAKQEIVDHCALMPSKFGCFSELSDEIQMNVMSFVGDAPFENLHEGENASMLTDALPLVSRKFCKFASSNTLWEMALRRAIQSENVWRRAASNASIDLDRIDPQMNRRELYKNLYDQEIAFTGPVFVMGMDEDSIPEMYTLYLFEPRYRYMIQQLLIQSQKWNERAAESSEDVGPAPPMYFLHAHRGLGSRGATSSSDQNETALLVQIVRCLGMPTGHYDVTLQVDAIVRIERFWVEPNTGHLFYAHGRRVKYV